MPNLADLFDEYPQQLRLLRLPWRRFGAKARVCAPVRTVRCFEDNSKVRQALSAPGDGAVLLVDGGGSQRVALTGDQIAELALQNNWQGLVINGAIRDSACIAEMDIALWALGTCPIKSHKRDQGAIDCDLTLAGVAIKPHDWLYADSDGIAIADKRLH